MSAPTGMISPYICVKDADEAIAFYQAAFGAQETLRLVDPTDGRIGHAEIMIGESRIMLSDEYPDFGAISPPTLGGSPVKFYVAVSDVEAAFAKAIAAGAIESRPFEDQFFGERSGSLIDPFGHTWTLSQKIEDVSASDMQRRWTEASQ